jgi:FkbM family methyltransferase
VFAEKLREIQKLNPGYRLIINELAAGEKNTVGKIEVAKRNAGAHTLVGGLLDPEERDYSTDIQIRRLDEYLVSKKIENINLIKIDTEGFEFSVLKGLKGYFESTPFRPPIVCEITVKAYGLLNASVGDLEAYMQSWGYHAYRIQDYSRMDLRHPGFRCGNVVFLSDAS